MVDMAPRELSESAAVTERQEEMRNRFDRLAQELMAKTEVLGEAAPTGELEEMAVR
jgi:hypothetical protein